MGFSTTIQARIKESVQSSSRSASDKWEFTLEVHGAEQLPEGVDSVELQWRRPGSKRKQGATASAGVGANRSASWNGEFLHQAATIYRKTSSAPISKYFEIRLVGRGPGRQKVVIGKALVDLSKYCTDPAPIYAGRSVFLELKPTGTVKVAIHADKSALNNSLGSYSSQMSVISDISSVGYDLDDSLKLGDFSPTMASSDGRRHTKSVPAGRWHPSSESPAGSPSTSTNPFIDDTGAPTSPAPAPDPFDMPEETGQAAGALGRATSLSREEKDFYLRELGSSDADDEPSRGKDRFRRSLKWLAYARKGKAEKITQPKSPDSVLEAPLDAALVVAQAGPAPCCVDLSRVELEEDPVYLRQKLRQLLEDRNEMAYRNWALDATNRILHAEMETAQAKLKQANDRLSSAKAREKSVQRKMQELEIKFRAARALASDKPQQGDSAYGMADLQDQLVMYKTQLAQAEFELLEMGQELRMSRRNTRESQCSTMSPGHDLTICSVPEEFPEDLSLDDINGVSQALETALADQPEIVMQPRTLLKTPVC